MVTTRPDPVEIVQAAPNHESDILPMMAAFNRAEGIPWQPATMTPALRQLLQNPALGVVLFAREHVAGAVVGYGLATFGYDIEFAGTDALIMELFVLPESRGQGIGHRLLDGLIEAVRNRGARAVHLMVRPENRRARVLYESRGFRVTPRVLMTKLFGENGS